MNKDAFYFPHFCNARHDRKVKRIMKELGIEGYGIFFMVLEVLREQLDFRYPLTDIDLLADEFGTSEIKVKAVIGSYQLFETDNENFFYSPKLNEYMEPYLKMKEQRTLAGRKSGEARRQRLLGKVNNNSSATVAERPFNDSATVAERNVNENEQSKVKESKVNKKEISAFFECIWILYPNKKGKDKVKDTQKAKLESLGIEQIQKCIERYKESKPDWQEWQNGSTFFNSGYVDYLDANYQPTTPKQTTPTTGYAKPTNPAYWEARKQFEG